MDVVHRRAAHRPIVRADVMAGERTDGHRRVGRTEARRAEVGNGNSAHLRHHGDAVEIGRLALIGRHAEGGVALHVLDRTETFAKGDSEVRRGDVVLEVDELFGAPTRRGNLGQRHRVGRG